MNKKGIIAYTNIIILFIVALIILTYNYTLKINKIESTYIFKALLGNIWAETKAYDLFEELKEDGFNSYGYVSSYDDLASASTNNKTDELGIYLMKSSSHFRIKLNKSINVKFYYLYEKNRYYILSREIYYA